MMTLSLCGNSNFDICSNGTLFDLEYADDVVRTGDPGELELFLGRLNDSVVMFGTYFAP